MLWNTRSAVNKIPAIIQYFADGGADFLVMCETWQACPTPGKLDTFSAALNEYASAESLHDVSIYTKARNSERRGGGLALITKNDVKFSYYNIDVSLPSSFEYLSMKCKSSTPFVFICLYRPPTTIAFSVFMQEFENFLSALNLLPLPAVVCGDFNIKINMVDDRESVLFSNLLFEFNFSVVMPDESTHRYGNVLDFLLTSVSFNSSCFFESVDNTISISDHYPVFFRFLSSKTAGHNVDLSRAYHVFRSIDEEAFTKDLLSCLQSLDFDSERTFGDMLSEYNQSLQSIVDQHAPLHRRSQSRRVKPGWMDQEYVRARALRKRLQRRADKTEYNIQNRLCQRMMHSKREAYNSALTRTLEGNQEKFYSVLNKLTGKGLNKSNFPSYDNPTSLANSFNHYFIEKVQGIRESLSVSSSNATSQTTIPTPGRVLDCFRPTDLDELLNIIKEHGVKTNPDDPLPDFLIQKYLDVLLPYLVLLVNLSLSTASCDGLTEAYVVPILKSLTLDHEEFKNYRPVSLLSFVSKLTERVVHARITAHLVENNLQNASQYGYKKHHSCENLLLKLLDDILVGVDSKSGVVVLFVDLSAAFDTVDHAVLLQILQNKFRITESALCWIKSFVSCRSQKVKIGGSFSDALLVAFGVPQGSILGPLLFNLYCSSIDEAFMSSGFHSMGYADDNFGLRIFPAFSAPSTLFVTVPNCLKAIKQWATSHFLKLNSDKTRVMLFGGSTFFAECPFNTFRNDLGVMLPISHSAKVLGVTLDSDLLFNQHISKIVSSVNFALRNIKLIRRCLSRKALETLMHSLIANKIDQCNSLLIGISETNLSKLQKLQNCAARLIFNLPSRSLNISERLRELHWLPVRSRIIFKYLITVFKCVNCLAPTQLSDKVRVECPLNMVLKTSGFRPKSALGKRAFTYLAPRYWNALPRDLRTIASLEAFKSNLKTYLFDNVRDLLHRIDPYTTFAVSQTGNTVFTNERLMLYGSSLQDDY